MTTIRSNAQRIVTVSIGDPGAGGHRVQGLAADPRPVEYARFGELVTLSHGLDGSLIAETQPGNIFGVMQTIKLMHGSASIPYFQRQLAYMQDAERNGTTHRIYGCTDNDLGAGVHNTMQGGVLSNISPMPEPGQIFEVVFAYEWHVFNADGMVVAATPAFTQ